MPARFLALAAASRRVGCVYLVRGQLTDWRMSDKAAKSPELAAAQATAWIAQLPPDVVVTERTEEAARKGDRTKAIIDAMAQAARETRVLSVTVVRCHDYANKYEEAEALAKRYPEIRAWLPKRRRFFDNEPRNTVLFEALSLAETAARGGPLLLAGAMG